MSGYFWVAPLVLTISLWFGWDALFAAVGWPGLRSTPLRLPLALIVTATTLVVAIALTWSNPLPAGWFILSAVAATVMHWSLAILRGRAFLPTLWSEPGAWDTHRTSAVTIPLGETTIPAFFYEPTTPYHAAVIVIHGAGAHKTFYAWPLFQSLVHAGFAVCAIDLDGHGDNQRVLDVPSVLDDPRATVDWLRQRADWIGLIGLSLGGCVAARAVAEGLAVDAVALLEAPRTIDITRRTIRHERRTLLRHATWALHRYGGSLPLARAWVTEPTRCRIGTVDLIRWLDLQRSLQNIPAPLWLCYGDNDGVIPPLEVKQIQAITPASADFVIVPRATHLSLQIDGRALRALTQWLAAVQEKASLPPDDHHLRVVESI